MHAAVRRQWAEVPLVVELLPAAEQEFGAAFAWYLERSWDAAQGFVHELDRALGLIGEAPRRSPELQAGVRQFVLQHFPYKLIFEESGDKVVVIAVMHQKRRPGYWRDRLGR